MSDVTLTHGVRSNLLQLQRNAALRQAVNQSLGTGKKVNSAADNPQDYVTAQALTDRVSTLFDQKSAINQALSSTQVAQTGLGAVQSLTKQLQGLAQSVQGGTADQRQAAAQQFDQIRRQISSIASDASYGGVKLIADPANNQTVTVGDTSGAQVTIQGQATSPASLGIGTAATDYNGFATNADINQAVSDLTRATGTLRSAQSNLGSTTATLTTRATFNQNLSNTLQSSADQLTGANLNEQAAKAVALRLQDRFSAAGLQSSVRTQSLVVDLLKTGNG